VTIILLLILLPLVLTGTTVMLWQQRQNRPFVLGFCGALLVFGLPCLVYALVYTSSSQAARSNPPAEAPATTPAPSSRPQDARATRLIGRLELAPVRQGPTA